MANRWQQLSSSPLSPNSSSGRSRRLRESSSDESSTGVFGVSNTKYRVGAPPVRPLPLENHKIPPHASRYETIRELKILIGELLRRNGIQNPPCAPTVEYLDSGFDDPDDDDDEDTAHIQIVNRMVPGQPNTVRPTVLITAQWNDQSQFAWDKVVRMIKIRVDDMLEQGQLRMNLDVEMIATQLAWPMYMSPIHNQPQLAAQWENMAKQIYSMLQSNPASGDSTRCIYLCRLGYFSTEPHRNPMTVYIAVDYDFPEDLWGPVVTMIEYFVRQFPGHLHVKMEHCAHERGAFQPLVPRERQTFAQGYPAPYSRALSMGSDVGPGLYLQTTSGERRHPGMGTIGCFVDVKISPNSAWKRLALTNYHVVRPSLGGLVVHNEKVEFALPNSPALRADRDGLKPSQQPSVLMEHPSRRRHNQHLSDLQEKIKSLGASQNASQRHRDNYVAKKAFFDNGQQLLGKIWAASGYCRRTKNNSRLDWALIEVPQDRPSSNVLPSQHAWKNDCPDPDGCGPNARLRLDTQGASVAKFKQWGEFFKFGAKTGPTAADYSEFRAVTKYANDKHLQAPPSLEYVFHGRYGPFSTPGDSGSAVFNTHGLLAGILFTGPVSHQASKGGYGYVTPIEDIFQDIKAFTGVFDVRLAQE